ncbi:coenzyme F420-dependent NADP oxidoreductase-like protein [Rhodothalassium salexigens DSM 2132]|uniref:Coenzyme F420-dependent NADP oxidoreductase-like protein n=1 Tax=Rhodothalassium salexigens DSM 2132 TaxID=1188247 RepID=A0A4R2PV81_RHOSA|nr:coenzyme F420-dependent NADP oxidoreductase-like protein [Rhodothalassium salexigens DSM 2132]
MKIGIIGSGLMGGKLGLLFAQVGHAVMFSYARSNRKLEDLARRAGNGAAPGTVADAVRDADAILLAVHWSRIDDVLFQAGDLTGKTIVTCCVPLRASNSELVVGLTDSGAEQIARKAPGARVAAAFQPPPQRGVCRCVRGTRHAAPAKLRGMRRRSARQECRRPADRRRWVRPGGRRPVADRSLHGTLRHADGPTGLRNRPGTELGLPVQASRSAVWDLTGGRGSRSSSSAIWTCHGFVPLL